VVTGENSELIQNHLSETSIVFSDKSTSYVDIEDIVEIHVMEKSNKEIAKTTFDRLALAVAKSY